VLVHGGVCWQGHHHIASEDVVFGHTDACHTFSGVLLKVEVGIRKGACRRLLTGLNTNTGGKTPKFRFMY